MKFEEFDQRTKHSIHAIASNFAQDFMRHNIVWSSEQLLKEFLIKRRRIINRLRRHWDSKTIMKEEWFFTREGKDFLTKKFDQMLTKHEKVARKKTSLVSWVKLGYPWSKTEYYEISYGKILPKDNVMIDRSLNRGDRLRYISSKVKTDFKSLGEVPYNAWTIEHIDDFLYHFYRTSLENVLRTLAP